ncbi:MAG TPA: hypothetical protein VHD87_17520 [Acidimicrobiales bacterium]|nr:hypothetical protein [Acidimicrobiales bacterium]
MAAINHWVGALWFGLYAIVSLAVAWWKRRQLAAGRVISSVTRDRLAMAIFAVSGSAAVALALREVARAL